MIVWDDFEPEALNSRSSCQQCRKHIMKGQPRVGQLSTFDRSQWMKWDHLACISVEQIKVSLFDAEEQVKQAKKILDLKLEMEAQNVIG